MDLTGTITHRYPGSVETTSVTGSPVGLTTGTDGAIWFVESNANFVGKIMPGALTLTPATMYSIPDTAACPLAQCGAYGITSGPDGNLWFTQELGNRIGVISTAGVVVKQIPLSPTVDDALPLGIVVGPDGNLWFSMYSSAASGVGRLPPSADGPEDVTVYLTPTPYNGKRTYRLVVGPDLAIWFSIPDGNALGRVTVSGTFSFFTGPPLPNDLRVSYALALGPDRDLWLTELEGNRVNRFEIDCVAKVPTLVASDGEICAGESLTLTATEPAGITYDSWQFYRGPTLVQDSASNVFTVPAAAVGDAGSYTVTGTTAEACVSNPSAAAAVDVSAVPTVTAGGGEVCATGATFTLTATPAGGSGTYASYQWYRNGSSISGANSSTYDATLAGSYTVTVTDDNLCTSAQSAPTVLRPLPTVTISPPASASFCAGSSLLLTANPAGGSGSFPVGGYQWYLGGVAIGGANASTHSATVAGSYTVTVTDSSACTSIPSSATVVTESPLPTVTISGDNVVCPGGWVELTAAPTGGSGAYASFEWSRNGSFIFDATSPTYTATQTGRYTVTVTDSNGCTSAPSEPAFVTVAALPDAAVTTAATVCALSNGTASVVDAGPGTSYAWTVTNGTITGGQGTSAITFKSAAFGTMQISVMVMASGGCSASGNASVPIDTLCSGPFLFYTVEPCRLVDTRGPDAPALAPSETREFVVAGSCAIPTTARSISANVTVTGATAPGSLRFWATETPVPATSSINFNAAQTRANNAILALAPDGSGRVSVRNISTGTVHAILDTNGYFE